MTFLLAAQPVRENFFHESLLYFLFFLMLQKILHILDVKDKYLEIWPYLLVF
jgi:hypothetical protein